MKNLFKNMFKVMLVLAVALTLVACNNDNKQDDKDIFVKSEGVMDYAQYKAAELESNVVIETFVQAKQSWWDDNGVGKGTFYTMDDKGGYFIYELNLSKEEYDKLVPGTKIKVEGTKKEWSGQVEITDATYTIEEGKYIATPVDVTAKYATEAIADYQNQLIALKDVEIAASKNGEEDAAFLYKYNGAGQRGDDIYFNVKIGDAVFTLTVESYLCDKDSETYKAAEALQIGQKVDLEGFLYWYKGAQPHITKITKK